MVRSSVERETELTSSHISSRIEATFSSDGIITGTYGALTMQNIFDSDDSIGNDMDMWLISGDGTIHVKNGQTVLGNIYSDRSLDAFRDITTDGQHKTDPYTEWFGTKTHILLQAVSWLMIKPVSDAIGRIFKDLLDATMNRNRILGGGLAGMMMATDMGGIINKVAYNYGVEGLAANNTDIMASVMIGGMVPPIGIFLSMLFFRDRFSKYEWDRGPTALFMGLSFITEGALPYVFTDFTRVIPSCMAGSAVAGTLSVLFGCTLPAPHGGIFVFPVMGHRLLYAIALIIGSFVTAFLLGLLKKPRSE